MSAKATHSNTEGLESAVRCLSTAFDAHPENDHSVALELVVDLTKNLGKELLTSTMPEHHALRQRARYVLERASLIQGRASGEKKSDIKPIITSSSASRAGVKLKFMEVPEFSGKTEDWLTFYRLFKNAVHHNPDLETPTKLHYLVQALKDPVQKATYAERMDEEGAYEKIIEELKAEYDKPRWMHRKYCESMRSLAPNLHTREGIGHVLANIRKHIRAYIIDINYNR